jgi:hypothetical protein
VGGILLRDQAAHPFLVLEPFAEPDPEHRQDDDAEDRFDQQRFLKGKDVDNGSGHINLLTWHDETDQFRTSVLMMQYSRVAAHCGRGPEMRISGCEDWRTAENHCRFWRWLFVQFLCWITAAALSLGPLMGDCIDGPGINCPTDHQRNIDLIKILVGAVVVNLAGLLTIGYVTGRSGSGRS